MSSKDAGLRIRVERELREAFQGACLAENRSAEAFNNVTLPDENVYKTAIEAALG